MSAARYRLLGLAHARSAWFRELSRWSTNAALPVEFVKCVALEELQARLASGRAFSAVIVDGGLAGVDRDLVDRAREAGAAVLVVDDGRRRVDWAALGADAVLPESFDRGAAAVHPDRPAPRPSRAPTSSPAPPGPAARRLAGPAGGGDRARPAAARRRWPWPLAQGLGIGVAPPRPGRARRPRPARRPGPAARRRRRRARAAGAGRGPPHATCPAVEQVRVAHLRGRRAGLRPAARPAPPPRLAGAAPRAVQAAIDSLLRSYRLVVADVDADLEGDDEVGSVDVEERNVLARSAAARADLVLVVAPPTLVGPAPARADARRAPPRSACRGDRLLPVVTRGTAPGPGARRDHPHARRAGGRARPEPARDAGRRRCSCPSGAGSTSCTAPAAPLPHAAGRARSPTRSRPLLDRAPLLPAAIDADRAGRRWCPDRSASWAERRRTGPVIAAARVSGP